ncbi:MAG TPA: glucose-6-phosphate dehydrogenase [Dehalococcoidia bacterium]|nr:glucose-6-phosphate dehydrogenase [Dehalococcoidia bacterium]
MTLARPAKQDIVIVGATGDLARRKLLPALYNLFLAGLLPDACSIVGFARSRIDTARFRELMRAAVEANSRTGIDAAAWEEFAPHLTYVLAGSGGYGELDRLCTEASRVFYLATPPEAVPEVVRSLEQHGLSKGARIVVEKPFGVDLPSAQRLNQMLHEAFREEQIYRIDHYLGKETVQNILVFRFANSVFEHVWNRDVIDHIEITVAESMGVESRGQFYEEVGALRDILQSHVLQMLALLTMEPPSSFSAEAIRDEKTKLLYAVSPVEPGRVVRGQYTAGAVGGESVAGYREEDGVARDSTTETFVALRLDIRNWRWAGIPVYLRTGKRLPYRATELEIAFKEVPIRYLSAVGGDRLHPNHLSHRIQPEEKITFQFLSKSPGPLMEAKPVTMSFSYDESFMVEPEEAYERLIHDILHGDQTLFVREDAIERAWSIVQPVIEAPPPIRFYAAGTWGPEEAKAIVEPNQWHLK